MSFKLLIGASFGHYFQINGGLGWDGKKVSQKMAVVDKTIFKKLGGWRRGGVWFILFYRTLSGLPIYFMLLSILRKVRLRLKN